MKLANIQYGLNQSRYQANGSHSYEDSTNIYESSGVSAYLKNKELPAGGSQPVTDYDLSIFNGIKGVYIGNKCITTTPELRKSIAYTYYGTIFDISQSGYTSNAFSNYVIGNYKGVWGFECVFQKRSLGSTDYLIEYGFDKNNTSQVEQMAYYKIGIDSVGRIVYERNWRGSGGWSTAVKDTLTTAGLDSVQAGKWYHLCLIRLGDGNTSHGSGTGGTTLAYLKKVADTDNELVGAEVHYYLPNVYYADSTWHTDSVLTDFVSASTQPYRYGTYLNYKNYTVNLHTINPNGAFYLADKLYLKGGTHYQSNLSWNINTGETSFATTMTNVTTEFHNNSKLRVNNQDISTTNKQTWRDANYYVWHNSI